MDSKPCCNAAVPKKIYTLQVLLTNHCNLHCEYCYVKREPRQSICVDTVKSAISTMIAEHPPSEWAYELCFMGGEPLAEFSKIRQICQWVWETFPHIRIHISSPTNGTLLNETIRAWLEENRTRFSLSLSYDGAFAQDSNRSQSASMIDPAYFRNLWPEQPFKMTISENQVDCLAKNILSAQEQGYLLSANAACGEPEWSIEHVQEFGRQMLILAQYYVDHPQIPLVDLINIDLCQVFYYRDTMPRRCGIGFHYDTIDFDGTHYPCHLFSSLALEPEAAEKARQYRMDQREDFTAAACRNCILNPVCPRCYGMSYLRTGDPFAIDRNLCLLFKQQIKGACSYHLKRMARLETLSEKDHRIIAAIRMILQNFHFA